MVVRFLSLDFLRVFEETLRSVDGIGPSALGWQSLLRLIEGSYTVAGYAIVSLPSHCVNKRD